MQLFFTRDIQGDFAFLSEAEARHCVQVLRKKNGDRIQFIDGLGGLYEAELQESRKNRCVLKIVDKKEDFEKRSFKLNIAIAPPKNIDRLEWFLEKATEIGIDEITPLLCQRSERRRIRNDRLEKIVLAATKQSLKAYLPKLNNLIDFKTFITHRDQLAGQQRFIAYCNDESLQTLHSRYRPGSDVTILIGPEGDFSPEEVKLALDHDFTGISLGRSRLRTETAGVVACHTINLMNND